MFAADFYVFMVFFVLLVAVPAGVVLAITTKDRERKR
jgi:hypothetical protein